MQLPVQAGQGTIAVGGNNGGLADAHGELAVASERRRDVERHAGLELPVDAGIEAQQRALAPVGREGGADGIAGAFAEVVREAVRVDDALAGFVDLGAGVSGLEGAERRVECFETAVQHGGGCRVGPGRSRPNA